MSTPTLDRELMGRLLLRVEADAHRKGWDGPPALLVLYDWHDGATEAAYRVLRSGCRAPVRCGQYAAQPMLGEGALDGFPQHGLFRLALNCYSPGEDHPFVARWLATVRQPGFLGMAFLCESWGWQGSPEERAAPGSARLADVPGAFELRNIVAADALGGDYLVSRRRGEKPRLDSCDEMAGSVIESLRMIVATVAGQPKPPAPQLPSAWQWADQTFLWAASHDRRRDRDRDG